MQIFPKRYSYDTHQVIKACKASDILPETRNSLDSSATTFDIVSDVKFIILEENVGSENLFHKVICTNQEFSDVPYFNREIWVESKNLKSLDLNKKKINTSTSFNDNPDKTAPVIDWTTKEPFIPFNDFKNGKYSVVIESDFEAIASVEHLNIIAKNAFYSGVDILLQSKGLKSGKGEIDRLLNEYWTFAAVEEFYVDTRKCVPIKLLVSIPLRFINGRNIVQDQRTQQEKAKYFIKFKAYEIVGIVDKLVAGFFKFEEEINDFLIPNGVITAFALSYEVFNIKTFLKSFIKLLNQAGYAFNETLNVDYEIGINEDYKIISVRITDGDKFYEIPYSIIATFSNIEPLNSRRTINYFINYSSIKNDINILKFKDFSDKYIAFPKPEFIKENITITIPGFSGLATPPTITSKDVSEAIKNANKAKFISGTTKQFMGIITDLKEFDNILDAEKKQEKLVSSPNIAKEAKEESFFGSVGSNLAENFDYNSSLAWYKNLAKVLANVSKRARLTEAAIKALICTLKKIDPNSKEYQQFIEQIGPELNQWLSYALFLAANDPSKIKKEDLISMGASGISLASQPLMQKYMSEEHLEIMYKIVAGLGAVASLAVTIKKGLKVTPTFKINKPKSPSSLMAQILNSTINVGLQIGFKKLSEEIMDLIQKSLCADESNPADFPGLNDLFKNPLNSTNPDNTPTSSQNEKQNIKNNRVAALNDSGILPPGQDPEVIVDLMKLLLDDISCVLTPREICGLLSDNVDENVVLIIKSIIRRKYLPEMKELLEEQKIRLLFKELGKRIDTSICDQINEIADSNPTAPSIQCSPQQLKLREDILNNKLPKELVNDQLANYNRRKLAEAEDLAKKIGNNFTFEFDKPLLCGNGEEGIVSPLDDVSIEMARRRLDSLLSPVYSTFNVEADEWKNAFVKQDQIEIKDEDGNHIFTKNVNIINKPLYLNLIDESTSTLALGEDFASYNFIVKNKFISPEVIQQIEGMPETDGVDKNLLMQQVNDILNKPLWTMSVVDSKFESYKINIERLNIPYYTTTLKKKNNILDTIQKFDRLVLNAKTEVKEGFFDDDDARDPREYLNNINEYVFDNLKSSILNLKMFSKTAPYKTFKNSDNQIKTDLIEAAFGLAEEDDDFVLTSYVDGTAYIKDFSLQKIPTLEQQLCGVDPHYLGIKKLKNEALKDFKDSFCNNNGESTDDGVRGLNALEKASLYICLKLMFRVYVTDYISKILPIFSAYPIESLTDNENFIDFLEKLIKEDMAIFGQKFTSDFEKYTEEYFQKLIEEGKIDSSLYKVSNFETIQTNVPSVSSYRYMIQDALKYCSKRIKKELIDKRLIENKEELQQILATNFLKAYDYITPDTDAEDRPSEKIYLEEYVLNLPEEETFLGISRETSKITYDSLFDFFEGSNDDGLILAGVSLVYQDGENKVILFSNEIPTGKTKEEVMEMDDGPKNDYLNSLRAEARKQFFQTENYKVFANVLPAEDMLLFLSFYSILCTLDNQDLFNSYISSKQKIYSAIVTLLRDKSYLGEGYDGTTSRDTIMGLLKKLGKSPFPMEEIRRNPDLLKSGGMEIVKALLKIPIDIIKLEAEASDPNISLSAKISTGVQIPLSIAWMFTEEQTKKDLMRKAPLVFKRLRDNVRVLPVFVPSFTLMPFGLFPGATGGFYLGINIVEEVLYNYQLLQERDIEEVSVPSDPNVPFSPKTEQKTITCTPELKKMLQEEVDMGD